MSKSNTKSERRKQRDLRQRQAVVLERWEDVQRLFHLDLDTSAKAAKALLRKREIRRASDLLRLIFLYSVCDLTLEMSGLVAYLLGLGYLSDVAVMERLQHSRDWLGMLVVQLLQQRCAALSQQAGIRLRLMDATVISKPGSKGTDWRIHLSLDLEALAISGVELSDASGGESLSRFRRYADEIWVADRGYAFASSLGAALAQDVWLVVRCNWQNVPLYLPSGERFDPIAWLEQVTQPSEQAVMLSADQQTYWLRLIVAPLPPEPAERARARARKAARRKGRTLSDRTLKAAGFLLLLTNLPVPAWPIARVLELYRLRWQVELLFKRFKSLLDFDQLRAKEDRLVQTYLLGKLLMALILDQLFSDARSRQPDWWTDTHRPLNVWGLTQFLWQTLIDLVRSPISPSHALSHLPKLARYLRHAPRARPSQDAFARNLFAQFSASCSSVVNVLPSEP